MQKAVTKVSRLIHEIHFYRGDVHVTAFV